MTNENTIDMHYTDEKAIESIKTALAKICSDQAGEPVFICIGSDRHILDCFGPLIGTMVKEKNSDIILYGKLDQPLHAKNISREMETIKSRHPDSIIIAIDASVGDIKDFGNIKLRKGHIIPGKALARKLPPVGDYAITGILGDHQERQSITLSNQGSLAPVYYMAKTVAAAICEFYAQRKNGQ